MKFSTAGLEAAGMDLVPPFRIELRLDPHAHDVIGLEDAPVTPLEFQTVARVLPGRRVSGIAVLDGERVFAKVFYGKGARRYWQRELQGARMVQDAAVAAPPVLGRGITADDVGFVVLYGVVEEARGVDENAPGEVLDTVRCLAELHQSELVQSDVHLDNFLVSPTGVHAVDADSVKRSVLLRQHFANLATLCAQRAPRWDADLPAVWDAYAAVRGEYVARMGSAQELTSLTRKARRERVRRYLKKTQRECTEFVHRRRFDLDFVCDRGHWRRLQHFMVFPERYMAEGTPLKLGNSATVVRCDIEGHSYIVKRYNLKSLWHRVRRWFRRRARNAWRNGHWLAFLKIRTARPLALLETRWGVFPGVAYLVMPDCGQLDLAHALVNDPACFERVREPAVALLAELNAAGLCHGDLKATNFMVDDEGVVLIDFDALRYGSSAPDVHRFLANWEETPELRQAWQNALKGVGLA